MNNKTTFLMFSIIVFCSFLPTRTASCAGRRISIGNKIPEFSTSDVSGKPFDYKHGSEKVLIAAFLSSQQKQSAQAATDIKRIMSKLTGFANRLSVVVAINDPNDQTFFRPEQNEPDPNKPGIVFHVVADKEHKLWGKFGIIVTPTVIVSDTNDTVLWVEAGHGYDFAPVVQARLNQALGIVQKIDPNEAARVKIVTNATVAARIKRHLQMAKMLQEKGRTESAITQMKQARELDPNSVKLALEIGNLLCSIGQGESALAIIEGVKTRGNIEKSKLLIIKGWAKRQMNNYEEAEKLLLEATKLNPKSGRAFFELGQIYQTRGEIEKAMLTYYQALSLVYGREMNISNRK
ncbi:MAG: tetratricopeptide repeat protein [Planctomycetes bacterium]|nr:tetratricopeptide repeat protein [Planctomycetota bacterium]